MNEVLIGNICSLCAMVSDSVSSVQKTHCRILAVQTLSQFFYAAGSIILKGYSSTVQNAVAVLRNVAAIKRIKSKTVEWILILLGVALGAAFNNLGLLGWLPIIANLEYSVAMFRFADDVRLLKAAFILNSVMYAVFNFMIKNYVGAVSCAVVIVTTAAALIKGARKKPAEAEETAEEPPEAANKRE